tara:strand:- start:1242 stop:1853 length:612 start_codon:yes stop_codon:yes gene_type:complete
MHSTFFQIPLILFLHTHLTSTQSTNLPPPPPGLFTAQTRITISNTSVSAAWTALTDFSAYATWNPFVRRAIVVSPLPLNLTLPEQYPVVGKDLYLRTQIPPLPFPVNENTPDDPLSTQFAYEKITVVDKEKGWLAWKYQPDTLLQAERWQAVSDAGNGGILYESYEVFDGVLAGVLRESMGEGLQKGFEAQGEGLKMLLEGLA